MGERASVPRNPNAGYRRRRQHTHLSYLLHNLPNREGRALLDLPVMVIVSLKVVLSLAVRAVSVTQP
jgi:hypothetical protein